MEKRRQSQCDRILQLLESCSGWKTEDFQWVHLPTLLRLGIASHTRRIHELRKAGHKIEMRDEYVDGQRRTAYRLVKA